MQPRCRTSARDAMAPALIEPPAAGVPQRGRPWWWRCCARAARCRAKPARACWWPPTRCSAPSAAAIWSCRRSPTPARCWRGGGAAVRAAHRAGPDARPMLRRRAGPALHAAGRRRPGRPGRCRAPRFTLQLYGAGHVGRAIVRLLAGIDCRVQWIDERESEFPRRRAAAAHRARLRRAGAGRGGAGAAGAFYLVLTHSHDLDLAHHRGHPAARRLRLVRPDRLQDQARALRAPAAGARLRGPVDRAHHLPDRPARHRRQGARGDRGGGGGAAAASQSASRIAPAPGQAREGARLQRPEEDRCAPRAAVASRRSAPARASRPAASSQVGQVAHRQHAGNARQRLPARAACTGLSTSTSV